MKVILLADIPGTGKKGQIVNVSDGYARNFLFPRKSAMPANDAAVREVERKNEAQRQREAEKRAAAEALAKSLSGKQILIKAKCGDKGRLYGSITTQEVAQALAAQHGIEIDKRKIEMPEPVRNVGDSEVSVWVYPELRAAMSLHVEALRE